MHLEGKGGHSAWAWIFIIEGAFTAGFGLLSFLILPRSPEQTAFLSAREKNYIILSLRESRAIGENDEADSFSWEEVRKAKVAVTNLASMIADKYRCRGAVGALSSVFCVAGFVIFLGILFKVQASNKTTVMYGSLFLTVGGINCSSPALAAWVANNVSPHVRRATAIAVLAGVTNAGGILSTWLLGTLSTGPRYKSGTITLLAFSVAMSFFISATWWFFFKENRKKEVMRTLCNRADEANGLGDRSAWYTYIL
ncbi:hypothetical protein H0H92_008534 [Tricholoma furcatifolium]|nr:hypothetical protein H0H92_008534 [Tricholoma furcatifolium]